MHRKTTETHPVVGRRSSAIRCHSPMVPHVVVLVWVTCASFATLLKPGVTSTGVIRNEFHKNLNVCQTYKQSIKTSFCNDRHFIKFNDAIDSKLIEKSTTLFITLCIYIYIYSSIVTHKCTCTYFDCVMHLLVLENQP